MKSKPTMTEFRANAKAYFMKARKEDVIIVHKGAEFKLSLHKDGKYGDWLSEKRRYKS